MAELITLRVQKQTGAPIRPFNVYMRHTDGMEGHKFVLVGTVHAYNIRHAEEMWNKEYGYNFGPVLIMKPLGKRHALMIEEGVD